MGTIRFPLRIKDYCRTKQTVSNKIYAIRASKIFNSDSAQRSNCERNYSEIQRKKYAKILQAQWNQLLLKKTQYLIRFKWNIRQLRKSGIISSQSRFTKDQN
ncbi:hypothetical protein FGO68_gene12722 [Halteria grandinella]|uniref:Uncharacterized protein n=1 Tax=Halteria grandinella TaxID=5974 RepID=A0A8J8NLP4_HALGN|nr:hypothetical protein FGO68_gene12722 [Halteria grandinella]